MRITGGQARGIQLKAPLGRETRPSTDRIRESVFGSIGSAIEGARVADLFAGTGAYGLEAISRGAQSVHFFETSAKALQCLKQNQAAVLKSAQRSHDVVATVQRDLFQSAPGSGLYDFIFVDPPYDSISGLVEKLFAEVIDRIAAPEANVLFELPGNLSPEIAGWQLVRRLGKAKRDQPTIAIYDKE